MSFKEISYEELSFNPMTLIGKDWMLVSAGNKDKGYNTMTASWGQMGAIWTDSLPAVSIYIRPSRYTKKFLDREEFFTLSFFSKDYKKSLAYLGSHSGRDEDKIKLSGLSPEFDEGTFYFKEAELVFICRKLYAAPILEEGFVDKGIIKENYPEKDFHTMYIGRIVKVLKK
ncbi:flavin reductase family protein [Peptoniphilus catoniae]|uniref:flavin reductase family protein n=1 Tax=Peptoniphilus catoniae TaxID=1660341 RepID=UPI0010FE8A4F|nr:flavin reductase [Peptoniphilus catoniae]